MNSLHHICPILTYYDSVLTHQLAEIIIYMGKFDFISQLIVPYLKICSSMDKLQLGKCQKTKMLH